MKIILRYYHDPGEGCSWSQGELSLARPRSGHCLVRVGEDLVVVGGGPDNYGSTQVKEKFVYLSNVTNESRAAYVPPDCTWRGI